MHHLSIRTATGFYLCGQCKVKASLDSAEININISAVSQLSDVRCICTAVGLYLRGRCDDSGVECHLATDDVLLSLKIAAVKLGLLRCSGNTAAIRREHLLLVGNGSTASIGTSCTACSHSKMLVNDEHRDVDWPEAAIHHRSRVKHHRRPWPSV